MPQKRIPRRSGRQIALLLSPSLATVWSGLTLIAARDDMLSGAARWSNTPFSLKPYTTHTRAMLARINDQHDKGYARDRFQLSVFSDTIS
jgi:hypothetical protein